MWTPRGSAVRPTSDRVRSALFQLVGQGVVGAAVLDLYAGTGAMGMEALSRGARSVVFVEQDARLCHAIGQNLESTGFAGEGEIRRSKVAQAIQSLEGSFDLVLLDPPYQLGGVPQVLRELSESGLLAENATVVIEHSSRGSLAEIYGKLRRKAFRKYGDTAVTLYGFHAKEV